MGGNGRPSGAAKTDSSFGWLVPQHRGLCQVRGAYAAVVKEGMRSGASRKEVSGQASSEIRNGTRSECRFHATRSTLRKTFRFKRPETSQCTQDTHIPREGG